MRRTHPPSDVSFDGFAVTTYRSVPSSPLVNDVVGMERRHLSWLRGVLANAQGCYATNQGKEHAELKWLLGELDLETVLIQADALHTQQVFFGSSQSRGPSSS